MALWISVIFAGIYQTAVIVSSQTIITNSTDIPSSRQEFQTQPTQTRAAITQRQISQSNAINCSNPDLAGLNLPCKPNGCYMRDMPISNNGDGDPCITGHHQIIQGGDYTIYRGQSEWGTSEHITPDLPVNKWFILKDNSGQCQNVVISNTNNLCIVPGFCDSQFPWYVGLGGDSLPEKFGDELESCLCMTDMTSRNTAVCCQQSIPLTIRSCGFYYIYKLSSPLPSITQGSICADSTSHELSHQPITNISSLSHQQVVRTTEKIPKQLNQLSSTIIQNLATVKFKLSLPYKVPLMGLINRFKLELVEILNNYFKRRAKRRGQSQKVPHLTVSNIYSIIGSPQIFKNNTETYLYYTFYSQSDLGNVTSQGTVVNAAGLIYNSAFSRHYAYILNVGAGIPSHVIYPGINSVSTARATQQPHKSKADQNTPANTGEWRIILYIVLVTIVIIIVSLLALGVYRMTLIKALRINRGRHLSKLEKWILCEAVSNEDTPVPLKYQTSHSLINNGTQTASSKEMTLYSCNGNGHTSNGQLRQIQDASTQINFIAEPKTKT